jgi:hypothetical protein
VCVVRPSGVSQGRSAERPPSNVSAEGTRSLKSWKLPSSNIGKDAGPSLHGARQTANQSRDRERAVETTLARYSMERVTIRAPTSPKGRTKIIFVPTNAGEGSAKPVA